MKNFVKTGEWQEDNEGRARQIWGPEAELKSLPGWLNRMFLKALKALLPSFICGYSYDKLS